MKLRLLAASVSLLLLAACSSGGGDSTPEAPKTASRLAYSDPGGTGWRLMRNASSTSTHLVLDLVPPAGAGGSGVALTLDVDSGKAAWSKVAPSDPESVHPGSVYDLGTGIQAVAGTVRNARQLVTVVSQKGATPAAAYDGTKAVLSVALDLSGTTLASGTPISLAVAKAQHLPATGEPVDIKGTLALGILTAQ